MSSIIKHAYNVKSGDVICSVWNYTDKKWTRTLIDKDGNEVNIHSLEVERSIRGSDMNWVICLYKTPVKNTNDKHIFLLDLDVQHKFRVWEHVN